MRKAIVERDSEYDHNTSFGLNKCRSSDNVESGADIRGHSSTEHMNQSHGDHDSSPGEAKRRGGFFGSEEGHSDNDYKK